MSWIFLASTGYFLNALAALGDKIVLGKILPKPLSYAFWQGILSSAAVFLIPFGFAILSLQDLALSLVAGLLWTFGLYFFFEALFLSDASRTLPIVLSLSPLFLFSFESFGLGATFSGDEIIGAIFLITGSVVLSFDLNNSAPYQLRRFGVFALLAALFFSISLFLTKELFLRETFLNVFIWSRFGMVFGAVLFLIWPATRREVFGSVAQIKKLRGAGPILLVKIIGSLGALLIFFAISQGSVALVNAMQGIQYAFVFIFALLASLFWPSLIQESFGFKAIVQKLGGIIFVSSGLFLLYFGLS